MRLVLAKWEQSDKNQFIVKLLVTRLGKSKAEQLIPDKKIALKKGPFCYHIENHY
jgi:precorrin-6x reductase